jgi:hypothetical protein
MNNTTKILIAGGAGVGAFFLYKFIKKQIDEKNAAELEAEKAAAEAKAIEEQKKKAEELEKGKTNTSKTRTYSAYEKRVMVLQELLKVAVDGDAGQQTNGTLDYWWVSDTSKDSNSMTDVGNRRLSGYKNLKANGKGVVSALNIEYYISTLQANNSPRQLVNKASANATARRNRGAKLIDEFKKGKTIRVIGGNNLKVSEYTYTQGVGYKPNGKSRIVNTNLFEQLTPYGFNPTDGYFILKAAGFPSVFVITNPNEYEAV